MKSVEAWLSLALFLMLGSYSAAQAPKVQPDRAEPKMPTLLNGEALKDDPKDDELKRLLKARYNEAVAEVEVLAKLYQAGRATYDSLGDARHRLLKAGLELCEKPADKVEVLTQFVLLSSESEKMARDRLQAGRGSEAAIRRFRYDRIDAQIQLVRAKREVEKVKGK